MEIGEGGLFLTLSERGNEGKWRKEAVGRTRRRTEGREGENISIALSLLGGMVLAPFNSTCDSFSFILVLY